MGFSSGRYGIPIPPPQGAPQGTLSWLLHADEDLLDYEFKSLGNIEIEPGPQYPLGTTTYYSTVRWDRDNPYYMHFYNGVIPFCTYFDIYYYDPDSPGAFPQEVKFHATPIPAAVWLLGSGLVGLVGLRKKSSNG